MWNHLRNLQQKPLHERKVAAYVLTILLFAVIVFLWVLFLNVEKVKKNNTSSLKSILSPFESVKDVLTGIFDGTQTVEFPALDTIVSNDVMTIGSSLNEVGEEQSGILNNGTTTEYVASSTLKIGTTPKASLSGNAGASTSPRQ